MMDQKEMHAGLFNRQTSIFDDTNNVAMMLTWLSDESQFFHFSQICFFLWFKLKKCPIYTRQRRLDEESRQSDFETMKVGRD